MIAFLAAAALAPASLDQPAAARPDTNTVAAITGSPEQGALLRGRTEPGASLTLNGIPVPVGPDGTFLIGFDRDAPPTATLAREGAGTLTLSVAPRSWDLQHVDVARRPGGATNEAFMRRRQPELAQIVAARTRHTDAQGWRQHFIWPARGRISGVFGSQRVYRGEPGAYHNGVDVAAGAGAPILAPADGVVVLATSAPFSLEGNLVIIDHGLGLNSAFLHLSRVDVREGQRLRQGEAIGTVGATGRATGPHLHWALTWNGARLDPERIAGEMR